MGEEEEGKGDTRKNRSKQQYFESQKDNMKETLRNSDHEEANRENRSKDFNSYTDDMQEMLRNTDHEEANKQEGIISKEINTNKEAKHQQYSSGFNEEDEIVAGREKVQNEYKQTSGEFKDTNNVDVDNKETPHQENTSNEYAQFESNDPHTVLGVSKNANDDEIKEAYRNLRGKHHPDKYTDLNEKEKANERMSAINVAYGKIKKNNPSFKTDTNSQNNSESPTGPFGSTNQKETYGDNNSTDLHSALLGNKIV